MDNNSILKMFSNMMQTMSDDEINQALDRAKPLLSPEDFSKLEEIVLKRKT